MAVEIQQIKDRIKALFPNVSLSNKRMDAISDRLLGQIKEEEQIDSVLKYANGLISFEDIAKEDDRIRTLEARTQKKEVKTTSSFEKEDKSSSQKEVEGMPDWAKIAFGNLTKQNEALTQEISTIKQGEILQNKKQVAVSTFESSKVLSGLDAQIKEKWINRMDLDSKTSLEDQVKGLEQEYTAIIQHTSDKSNYAGVPPNGNNTSEATDDEIDLIIG